jgi:hypothetical protein
MLGVCSGMSCTQPDYTRWHLAFDYTGSAPGSSGGSGDRHLVVSNSPEAVTFIPPYGGLPLTLYKCEIPTGLTPAKLRIFLWHENGFQYPKVRCNLLDQ